MKELDDKLETKGSTEMESTERDNKSENSDKKGFLARMARILAAVAAVGSSIAEGQQRTAADEESQVFELSPFTVEGTDNEDKFIVYGRGILHLSILIETMRREGYELQVGQPQVIIKEIDGVKCEPVEEMTIDLPEGVSGKAIEMVTLRKGEMTSMEAKGDRMVCQFIIPSRGIIGLRNQLLTATAGEAIMAHRFKEYQPLKGGIPERQNGSLVSMEKGQAIPYSIDKLQDRGKFFIDPGEDIYEGQVIGENSRQGDLVVNVTKTKKMSNMRSSGADDKVKLAPPKRFSLEEALEYIQSDEYVEVTPQTIRLRKILLKETDRKRSGNKS